MLYLQGKISRFIVNSNNKSHVSHLTHPNPSPRPGFLNSLSRRTNSSRMLRSTSVWKCSNWPRTAFCSSVWSVFKTPVTTVKDAKWAVPLGSGLAQQSAVSHCRPLSSFYTATWQSLRPNVIPPGSFSETVSPAVGGRQSLPVLRFALMTNDGEREIHTLSPNIHLSLSSLRAMLISTVRRSAKAKFQRTKALFFLNFPANQGQRLKPEGMTAAFCWSLWAVLSPFADLSSRVWQKPTNLPQLRQNGNCFFMYRDFKRLWLPVHIFSIWI